jgi:ComF family protein
MIKKWLGAFVALLYPRLCPGCFNALMQHERVVCASCKNELPLFRESELSDNEIDKVFWGRVKLEKASSMYRFVKQGKIQHIIHAVKYKGNEALGFELGRWMGHYYKETPFYQVDMLVPVPLHPKKEYQRGYNQSYLLAQGMSEVWETPVVNLLKRTSYTDSQTRKGRFQRWKNVETLFEINDSYNIENKHILLIDDVLTTGATLEACARALLDVENVKVSILTLARA